MRPSFDDEDPFAQLSGRPFGDRQAEEPGADNEEVEAIIHRLQGYPTARRATFKRRSQRPTGHPSPNPPR
ncbi:hypothetical protein MINS_04550 [Mycolicibacterium insubricum]|nr:hypothetical protein MINS_04550 [Mycolicibacterium insubricum]